MTLLPTQQTPREVDPVVPSSRPSTSRQVEESQSDDSFNDDSELSLLIQSS